MNCFRVAAAFNTLKENRAVYLFFFLVYSGGVEVFFFVGGAGEKGKVDQLTSSQTTVNFRK